MANVWGNFDSPTGHENLINQAQLIYLETIVLDFGFEIIPVQPSQGIK
jgi:hypothetical protein